ncbi:MAG: hypothetical protein QOH47_2367 [Sphingomonadales bacterium]|jgi:3'-phosphoadenosine 5'-phosphosulfate sulfotransferase (PAPS reductase)/FAD synthetase|nr:hypothetical protein [Sphingomonadales bacterium]
MMGGRVVCWFSCGAASAVAARITLSENPGAVIAYCETGSEHPDNERFLADCVRWFNVPVQRLKTPNYADTWEMWTKRRFLSGPHGAGCTGEFKVAPRLDFQLPSDTHVFGYTADKADRKRADNFRETYPLLKVSMPLIDAGLTKANVLALIGGAGIKLPVMYGLGFHNNNCIPCVKATSPDYWSLVRRSFPAEFERMAKLSRELGVRLTRIKDVRVFIDEIPADWPCTNPIAPACDFLCQFAAPDFGQAA